jgi:hypothetical protein
MRAVYRYATNPSYAMFRYGEDRSSAENGAVGLMMLRTSLNLNNAQSYLIRYFSQSYRLYLMQGNYEPWAIGPTISEPYPPVAGDILTVVYRRSGSQNLFDVYLNGEFRGTLADADGLLNPDTYYAGVAFENATVGRIASVDDFVVGGAAGNSPPHAFALLAPEDGEIVGGEAMTFMWHTAEDIDPSPTVRYELSVDADSLFPSGATATDIAETLYILDASGFQDATVYYWQVVAYDEYGERTPASSFFSFLYSDGIDIDDPFAGGPDLPRVAGLRQNYPNPFNPSTAIGYEVPLLAGKGSHEGLPVSLVVYDARGRRVRNLVEKSVTPGRYIAVWDGRDERGTPAPTGTYLSTLTVAGDRISRKLLLIR